MQLNYLMLLMSINLRCVFQILKKKCTDANSHLFHLSKHLYMGRIKILYILCEDHIYPFLFHYIFSANHPLKYFTKYFFAS